MLEEEVDEKYYLSKTGIEYFKEQAKNRDDNLEQYDTRKIIKVAHGYNQGSVNDLDICPTLDINFSQFWRGVILEPKLLIKNATKKGYDEAVEGDSVNLQQPNSKTRIRKLTPKECWRLMGFKDEEFEKAEKVNSNAQLYKQAGNSIVVDVLEKIFRNLLKGE